MNWPFIWQLLWFSLFLLCFAAWRRNRAKVRRYEATLALQKRLDGGNDEPKPKPKRYEFHPTADISAVELGYFITNHLTWEGAKAAHYRDIVLNCELASANSYWDEKAMQRTPCRRHFKEV